MGSAKSSPPCGYDGVGVGVEVEDSIGNYGNIPPLLWGIVLVACWSVGVEVHNGPLGREEWGRSSIMSVLL